MKSDNQSPAELLASTKPTRSARRKAVFTCRLREKRLSLGLTMADVCAATKMSQAGLSLIERGAEVQLSTAFRLCRFFGCQVTDLWPMPDGDGDDEPSIEGRKRFPPDGRYCANEMPGTPCKCKPKCQRPCKGECGCPACRESYGDFLSFE